jgi:glycerophosphoryl diester phosphodiesterase
MKRRRLLVWLTLVVVGVAAVAAAASTGRAEGGDDNSRREPIVIAHRGASGDRPEHTLAGYEHAIDLGADYIEPDLVSTKDGILVARHENEIGGTTDVASHPEFAALRKTKTIDGVPITGWFTEDFTLAELKTLRAKERLPALRPANTAFDGLYEVPTFQEVIDLAKREHVGIYPETKHPTYFDSIGLSLEEPLVATLKRNGWNGKGAPVFVQSFEVANLKQLNRMTNVPLVQLLDGVGRPYDFTAAGDTRTYADLATPAGLHEIASYADGIGANKGLIVPRDAANRLGQPTSLIRDAHRADLIVHAWTFRKENEFLAADHRQGNPVSPFYRAAVGDLAGELELFFGLGLDGVFSDNSDVAVAARDEIFDD